MKPPLIELRIMKELLYSSLVIAITFSSCFNKFEESGGVNERVILIFDNAPVQHEAAILSRKLSRLYYDTITYIDENGDFRTFCPVRIGYDTLAIPAYKGYAEVLHQYQGIEAISYLFEAGDTILFSYDGNHRPTAKSLTSDKKTWQYNLPYESRDVFNQKLGYMNGTVLNDAIFERAYSYFSEPRYKTKYPGLDSDMKRLYVNLDSLEKCYGEYLLRYIEKVDSLDLDQRVATHYRTVVPGAVRKNPEEIVKSDSLMHYVSYFIKSLEYFAEDDASVAFERIAEDSVACKMAKRQLMKWQIMRMRDGDGGWHQYDPDVINHCVDQYVSATGDSTVLTEEVEKISVRPVAGYTYDLLLEDLSGNVIEMGELLKEYSGVRVFVDFWASWCGPCRESMAASIKLREELAGDNVAFMFISTDRNRASWRKAALDEKTDWNSVSYRVVNEKPVFFEQINLRYIPRYIIIDESGVVEDIDAPRPGSSVLKDKLLK